MTAREIDDAARELRRIRNRSIEATALSIGCALVAVAAAPVALGVTIAFAAGAGVGALVAIVSRLIRLDQIALLALEPAAYELAEVSRYASRLTGRVERERLASWLVEILGEVCIPGNCYLEARVTRYADDLAALARDLTDPRAHVPPASAAACHLLLTQAVDSPLYNPAIPADRLPAIIRKIRLGINIGSG
jgi:hypothetical protein